MGNFKVFLNNLPFNQKPKMQNQIPFDM